MLVNVVSWFTRLFLHWRGVVGRGCPLGFDLWVDQGGWLCGLMDGV